MKSEESFNQDLKIYYGEENQKPRKKSSLWKILSLKGDRFLISLKSERKQRWDYFVLVLALYNSFTIPLEQAYSPNFLKSSFSSMLDVLIDVLFLVDIILMFFTSYINKRGKETFDQEQIARAYVSTRRFWFDFFSLFGTSLFQNISKFFVFFGLFKMMRIFRLNEMINAANVDKSTKGTMKLFKLIFYLIFLIHCMACYLWLTVCVNSPTRYLLDWELGRYVRDYSFEERERWERKGYSDDFIIDLISYKDEQGNVVKFSEEISQDIYWGEYRTFQEEYFPHPESLDPREMEDFEKWSVLPTFWYQPADWINFPDQKLFTNDYGFAMRYYIMFYYSILILGTNEMGPVNVVEILVMAILLLISSLINALVFGDIASLTMDLTRKTTEQQEHLDQANGIMINCIHLEETAQAEVREFFTQTRELRD